MSAVTGKRTCRMCGCTEDNACVDETTGDACSWTDEDLCSFCDEFTAAYLAARAAGAIEDLGEIVSGEEAEAYLRARRGGEVS